ncbi:hypothetical protein COLO4_13581 [Corchorus olitorius]|uniref:DUF4220 domain-containing protein n=1 Tax=Corchorus olitorius TaxID=93759 RepID=A0A1R3JVR5_9ROSI|nr:hypothetical protein COLO4_13581 [Corchorus olitorius]
MEETGPEEYASVDDYIITEAHNLLQKFKGVFANLLLSRPVVEKSRSLFSEMNPQRAFDVIETELGFMYDLLYTKAKVIYTPWGLASRSLTLALTCSVLVLFSFGHDKNKYQKVDVFITFLLLTVGVFLEIYAVLVLLLSDQTRLWLIKRKKVKLDKQQNKIKSAQGTTDRRRSVASKPTNCFKLLFSFPRWSGLMAQCSLLRLCVEEKPGLKLLGPIILLAKKKLLGPYIYVTFSKVTLDLKSLIFNNVKQNLDRIQEPFRKRLIYARNHRYGTPLLYHIELDLDKNILTWHIATEICYYEDGDQIENENNCGSSSRGVSLTISRYLVYLLLFYPSMLPIRKSSINLRDLLADTRKLFKDELPKRSSNDVSKTTENALRSLWYNDDIPLNKVKGDREKKAIMQGSRV